MQWNAENTSSYTKLPSTSGLPHPLAHNMHRYVLFLVFPIVLLTFLGSSHASKSDDSIADSAITYLNTFPDPNNIIDTKRLKVAEQLDVFNIDHEVEVGWYDINTPEEAATETGSHDAHKLDGSLGTETVWYSAEEFRAQYGLGDTGDVDHSGV